MSSAAAIFDGDDTLWWVEGLYDSALDEAEALVAAAGLPGDEWRRRQRELDLVNVGALGMSPERFPRSSVEALEQIAVEHGVAVDGELRGAVRLASESVFTRQAPGVECAREVLQTLAGRFQRVLLTKGDRGVQERRIAESGLADSFEAIRIVDDKNEQVFSDVLDDLGCVPRLSWSIGNSLASDINPALRIGMEAIWIDAHVWEHERREIIPVEPHLVVLHDLRDVPDVVLTKELELRG